MDSLTGVCIEYIKDEHKHSTQILEMTTAHLQHLRLLREKKKAQLQDLREQSLRARGLRAQGSFDKGVAAAESKLEAHFSLVDLRWKKRSRRKVLAGKQTTELLEKLKGGRC